nr:MAG TPA: MITOCHONDRIAL RIBOSOME, LARGE SUBUNIT RIBOSOME, LARGE RIBOSOMAL SUBUNIT.1A [Caudoviricetes sp.]
MGKGKSIPCCWSARVVGMEFEPPYGNVSTPSRAF